MTTLLAALLFQPLRDRVRALVDRFYYKDSYDYRRTLVQFSREMTSSLDLEQLASSMIRHITSTFKIEHLDLFLKVGMNQFESFIDQKLKNYSSGMQLRLAFSIAIQVDFEILLLDEVLAVGDQNFQQKCFATAMMQKKSGMK